MVMQTTFLATVKEPYFCLLGGFAHWG